MRREGRGTRWDENKKTQMRLDRRKDEWDKKEEKEKKMRQERKKQKRVRQEKMKKMRRKITTHLKLLAGVTHDIPAMNFALKWGYEDTWPHDISDGGHPGPAKTFRAGHSMTSAPSMGHAHYVTNTGHTSPANTARAWSISSGRLQKRWKLTHLSILHQSLPSSAHCRHKYHFPSLSLLSRSILLSFEIHTVQGKEEILGPFESNARS